MESGEGAEGTHEANSVLDWVDPDSGVDEYHFSGSITRFLFEGDANVYLDGNTIDPTKLSSET